MLAVQLASAQNIVAAAWPAYGARLAQHGAGEYELAMR